MRNREKKEKQCLYCGKDIPNRNVYCNNKCQGEHLIKQRFELIINGDFHKIGNNASIDRATKKYLIDVYGEKCMKCGWNDHNLWTGKIPIELNHIDGNPENHDLNNCELLCPNCHSLSEFTKSRGKGRKWRKTIIIK